MSRNACSTCLRSSVCRLSPYGLKKLRMTSYFLLDLSKRLIAARSAPGIPVSRNFKNSGNEVIHGLALINLSVG